MDDYYLLEWDTRFFGYKIAGIKTFGLGLDRLNNIIARLREENFKLAYCFADPEDRISNDSFRLANAYPADEKVTYSSPIKDENIFPDSGNIIPYNLNYSLEQLKSLALQSGVYSRFRTDPGFRNNEFEKLYLEWIEKSVNKILSSEVLIYKESQEILGFITLVIHNDIGSIGLIAVDENQRGKAIGKKLVNAAFHYFNDRKIQEIEVVTQKANYMACRFYESCGFEIKSIVNIYHLWIR